MCELFTNPRMSRIQELHQLQATKHNFAPKAIHTLYQSQTKHVKDQYTYFKWKLNYSSDTNLLGTESPMEFTKNTLIYMFGHYSN